MLGPLGHSRFLECHDVLSVFKASSGLNGKRGLLRLSVPHLILSSRWDALTLYLALSLPELPRMLGPLEFCVLRAVKMRYANRRARIRGRTHAVHLLCSRACFIVPWDFT